MTQIVLSNSIQSYLIQANRFPLLSMKEEFELAVRFRKQNDLDAAHKLITSNLRFVVKIAMEYREYGFRLADLIQEGNIGLMKAVKKFDPFKGCRLITYAVWWIRSHIQAFILKNWNLVNKGVAALKKKLFYRLESRKPSDARLETGDGNLVTGGWEKGENAEYRDLSLDNHILSDEGEEGNTYLDMLPDTSLNPEDAALIVQEQNVVRDEILNALSTLNKKERYVIENRMMKEPSLTLQEIGDSLGVSRERVRQIEKEAVTKLKNINKLKMLANLEN